MVTAQVPDRGDLIWLEFDPQAGHEQAKRRPALVLSPRRYNRLSQLALVCPVTSQFKGYAFDVDLPPGLKTRGVVQADQVRSLDWRARRARAIESVPPELVRAVIERVLALLLD
jgi:mRNA interferase MazF